MDIKKIASEYLRNPEKITDDYYKKALDHINELCCQKNVDINTFMKDKGNIPLVADSIYSQLGFLQKAVIKKDMIKELIEENYDFIYNKFQEITKQSVKFKK